MGGAPVPSNSGASIAGAGVGASHAREALGDNGFHRTSGGAESRATPERGAKVNQACAIDNSTPGTGCFGLDCRNEMHVKP